VLGQIVYGPPTALQAPVARLQVWPCGHADVPVHVPLLQTSVVQATPSLQGAVLFAKTQPVAGLQLSVVHTLLSLQTTGVPGVHVPL
jgi:hypothetical protein